MAAGARRRSMGTNNIDSFRPAQLPPWVEDVVQERLAMAAKQQQQVPVQPVVVNQKANNMHDDEEERPDKLPLWVEEVVQERLEDERQQETTDVAPNQQVTVSNESGNLVLDRHRVGNYIVGMATTPKNSFTDMLDLGVPLDAHRPGSTDVLMIYSNKHVVPFDLMNYTGSGLAQLSPEKATERCDYVHVILTDHNDNRQRNQCLAIVPQYESYHIQRWGRFNAETKIVEKGFPLQLIPHGTKKKGRQVSRFLSKSVPTKAKPIRRTALGLRCCCCCYMPRFFAN